MREPKPADLTFNIEGGEVLQPQATIELRRVSCSKRNQRQLLLLRPRARPEHRVRRQSLRCLETGVIAFFIRATRSG